VTSDLVGCERKMWCDRGRIHRPQQQRRQLFVQAVQNCNARDRLQGQTSAFYKIESFSLFLVQTGTNLKSSQYHVTTTLLKQLMCTATLLGESIQTHCRRIVLYTVIKFNDSSVEQKSKRSHSGNCRSCKTVEQVPHANSYDSCWPSC